MTNFLKNMLTPDICRDMIYISSGDITRVDHVMPPHKEIINETDKTRTAFRKLFLYSSMP